MKELSVRILIFNTLLLIILTLLSLVLPEGLEKGSLFLDELKAIVLPPIALVVNFIVFNYFFWYVGGWIKQVSSLFLHTK